MMGQTYERAPLEPHNLVFHMLYVEVHLPKMTYQQTYVLIQFVLANLYSSC